MKKHELKDYQKTIQDVLANSEDDPAPGDQGQNRAEAMSTPSPAGSDGSRVRLLKKKIPKFDFLSLNFEIYSQLSVIDLVYYFSPVTTTPVERIVSEACPPLPLLPPSV